MRFLKIIKTFRKINFERKVSIFFCFSASNNNTMSLANNNAHNILASHSNEKFDRSTAFRRIMLFITVSLLLILSFFVFSPRQEKNGMINQQSNHDYHSHPDLLSSTFDSFGANENSTSSFIQEFIRNDDKNDNVSYDADEQFIGFYDRLKNSKAESSMNNCRFKRQHYWNFNEQSCLPIPGLLSAKLGNKYDVIISASNQELQCLDKNDKLRKITREQISSSVLEEWKPVGYWKDKPFLPIPSINNLGQNENSSDESIINSIYQNFQFATSWMFREWKYWKPHPKKRRISLKVEVNNISNGKDDGDFIKGSHQSSFENLYLLENFCIEPFSGISGYFTPNQSVIEGDLSNPLFPYKGKDDTRNFFHNEKTFMSFFHSQRIEKLPSPPKFLDDRLVIFLRVAPMARFHIYHTLNKFLATLGILRKLKLFRGKTNEKINVSVLASPSITPLLIFVNEPMDDRYDSSRTPSFGYFYQLLSEFAWASVSVPNHIVQIAGAKMDVMDHISHQYHEKLFNLTGHNYSQEVFQRATSPTTREEFRVCFRKAVLYQNCFDCSHSHFSGENGIDTLMHRDYETESYSFGMWQVADRPRISLVNHYRQLVDSCLSPIVPSPSFSSKENMKKYNVPISLRKIGTQYRLPSVYFALRTRTRRIIRDFPLMVDVLQSSLVHNSGFVDEILFREPLNAVIPKSNRNGNHVDNILESNFSQITYVKEIRSKADIFVGIHGGDFAMTSLMPNDKNGGGVVIEFSFEDAICRYVKPNQNDDYDEEKLKVMKLRNEMFGEGRSGTEESQKQNNESNNNNLTSTMKFQQLSTNAERCWFGVYADAAKADHWIFLLSPYSGSRKQIVVSPGLFIDAIREGACRWLFKKYGSDEKIRAEIKKLRRKNANTENNNTLKTEPNKVARAMWLCLAMAKEKRRRQTPIRATEDVDISWNKRLRVERVLESVITTTTASNESSSPPLIFIRPVDPRFLRFLWFAFTPSNIDIPPKRIQHFAAALTSKLNARIVKNKIWSSDKLPFLFVSNVSSVKIWNAVLARVLLKDDGDKIFENSNEEEKVQKKDARFTVKEMSANSESDQEKVECLPFGKDGEESCLYL